MGGMEMALAELPLALFSTLAPMGAGAFLLMTVAFFTRPFDDASLRRVDRLTLIPLVIVVIGFVCAFFHLASPQHALGVFANLGSSPMSNEIFVGVIFCLVAFAYWIVTLCARPSLGVHRVLCAIVAIVGLVFCVFVGLAYGVDTIPSWNNPMTPLSTLCFGILGGCAVGMVVVGPTGSEGAHSISHGFESAAVVLSWIGSIGAVVFVGIQMGMTWGMSNNMMYGSDLVGPMLPWIVVAVIVLLATGWLLTSEIKKSRAGFFPWLVVILAFAGILLARLAFYAIEFSVGLGI